jgi:hypothetical protein
MIRILPPEVMPAIGAGLALLPVSMGSVPARVQLVANGLQESGFGARVQDGGPARGWWQFERSGTYAVLTNPDTADLARVICDAREVTPTTTDVYEMLSRDDVLAAGFARLLLWADHLQLPALGDMHSAWDCYLRTWRPGEPRLKDWPANYASALFAVTGRAT